MYIFIFDFVIIDFHVTFVRNSKSFLKNMSYTLSEVEIVSKWPLDLQPSAAQALLRFFLAPGAEINLMTGNKSGKYTTENWAIFQFD